MIPLAYATILFNLAPFWTSILAYFINGEQIYKLEFVAMTVTLGCIIAMTLTGSKSEDEAPGQNMMLGTILLVICSFFNSGVGIANRRLQGTPIPVVLFFHSLLGFFVPLIFVLIYDTVNNTGFLHYTGPAFLWMGFGAISDLIACGFQTLAY